MDATKFEKKLKRKLLQVSQRFPDSNLTNTVSDIPSVTVFIGNGGIDCGVSSDLLSALFLHHDSSLDHSEYRNDDIAMIHMKPNLDFSVVEFTSVACAKRVLTRLNGCCVQDLVREWSLFRFAPSHLMAGPPLHLLMAYLSEIPPVFRSDPAVSVVPVGNNHSTLLQHQQRPAAQLPSGCFLLDGFVTDTEELELLKFFSTDFSKLSESVRRCIDWEKSVQDKEQLIDFQGSCLSGSPTVSRCLELTGYMDTHKDLDGKIHLCPPEAVERKTLLLIPKDTYGKAENPEKKTDDLVPEVKAPLYTHLKLRTVHHYGYEFLYGSNTIDPAMPLPDGLPAITDFVIERLMGTGLVAHRPDQLTVNEYQPGAGIPRHVDTHSAFKDGISLITLGSQTVMQFQDTSGKKVDVLLPRKSLLVMKGEARYMWTHCIPARKSDVVNSLTPGVNFLGIRKRFGHLVIDRYTRVSLTLRKIHCGPCKCDYPGMCDYRGST